MTSLIVIVILDDAADDNNSGPNDDDDGNGSQWSVINISNQYIGDCFLR